MLTAILEGIEKAIDDLEVFDDPSPVRRPLR
jgi:hypothetical protein